MNLKEFSNKIKDFAKKSELEVLSTYKNGNFFVGLCSDGTRIIETIKESDSHFIPKFAMNCDVKITNRCDANCEYCHEGSQENGEEGDLDLPIFDTWRAGTEMAIGGGNALSHPQLLPFLQRMHDRGVVCNITINQKHLKLYWGMIMRLISDNLIHGLGISLTDSSITEDMDLIEKLDQLNKNVVIHVINGIFSEKDLKIVKDKKLLILGYKDNIGRGCFYYKSNEDKINTNMEWLRKNLRELYKIVKVVSFDNLSIRQLDVKNTMNISDDRWLEMYQGDDYGNLKEGDYPFTFYFDAVTKTIGRSSTQLLRDRIPYSNQTFDECYKESLRCLKG